MEAEWLAETVELRLAETVFFCLEAGTACLEAGTARLVRLYG